jgi:hypothetical protein
MRLCVALVLASLLAPRVQADEDDPKMTRQSESPREVTSEASPPPSVMLPDEDDPKLARGAPIRRWWQLAHDVPRFKVAYR